LSVKGGTLLAAVIGSAVVFVDSTVVNVALPRIGRELPSSVLGVLEGQSYVYNGYLLTLSALLILAGALNDFYGRRRVFAIGLVGFGATSVLCGLAPSLELLVLFRVLQGAAGALLVPSSLSLITAAFQGEEQGRAFGIWAGASSATTLIGPFLGGVLVDSWSWRAAFFINVPLVLLALWATFTFVRESRDDAATGRFDWLGALVVALAVGGLSFGTISGQQREWRDPIAFVVLGIGAISAIALPFLMARRAHALIPLDLFRSRNFSVTNLSTFLIYGALYVGLYFTGLFMQGTLGYTAASAGIAGVPGFLFLVLLSSRFGALAARHGPRIFMTIGPALMTVGMLWFTRVPSSSTPWALRAGDPSSYMPPASYFVDFLPGNLVFGFGLAMMVAPLTTALMTSVPVRNSGVASAVNNAISRVGPQLAGALIFVAITASFYSGLHARVPGLDPSQSVVRESYAPLNPPKGCGAQPCAPDDIRRFEEPAREASTDAFHLAVLVAASLLATGGIVNGVGIADKRGGEVAAERA